jgi:hypothetical protein
MNNQYRSSIQFAILGDSHVKYFPVNFITPCYRIITKAIRGLKWLDYDDEKLSLINLLSSSQMKSFLSEIEGIFLLIGTNSVRIFSASHIISQIQDVIIFLRRTYVHLNRRQSIIIPLAFPCYKTTRRFPTERSLIRNIQSYNQQLQQISNEFNFTVVNLHIQKHHLANDKMHIHFHYNRRIFFHIRDNFDKLIERSSRITTTTNSSVHSVSTSYSIAYTRKSFEDRNRSRETSRNRE